MDNQRKLEELVKKIKSIKDLRDAIKTYKDFKKDENYKAPSNPQPSVEVPKPELGNGLQYLGRKKLVDGHLTHMIGIKGSNHPYYELTVDLHKHSQKLPSISIRNVASNGGLLSQNNHTYNNIGQAVKEINNHFLSKRWS